MVCVEVFEPEEEIEELDDMDDDELARCALLRGINIRVTSSELMELRP